MDDIRRAVEIELTGPRKQLRYRAIHKKIRQLYELNVPRGLAYNVTPNDWKNEILVEKRGRKVILSLPRSNWVHSLDG